MPVIAPYAKPYFPADTGQPLAAGKLYTFETGTSTPKTTYKYSTGTAHTNPIILDARGEPPDDSGIYLDSDIAYRWVLKDENDVEIWTRDNITTKIEASQLYGVTPIQVATIAAMIVMPLPADGSLVQPAEYYAGQGWRPKVRRFILDSTPPTETGGTVIHHSSGLGYFSLDETSGVDIREFGAKYDGSTDDTDAHNSAFANTAWSISPAGKTTKITDQLTIPAFHKWTGGGKYSSLISKEFDGDFAILGTGTKIDDLGILGNGATYTGRGLLLNSGSGKQVIGGGTRIIDFDDYCVECTAAGAGTGMVIQPGAEIVRTGAGDVAIMLPVDVAATPRFFIGVNASSSALLDANETDNTLVGFCFMRNIVTRPLSRKLILGCNRIATVGNELELLGVQHTIVGNVVAGDITAGDGLTFSEIVGNISAGIVVDESESASNSIDSYSLLFTPTWTAATTDPTIGNGSISGNIIRKGKVVVVQIQLIIGSTTTTGTGAWSFGFPADLQYLKGKFDSVGGAIGLRSGVAFQTAVTRGNTSPSIMAINATSHAGANNWGPTIPVTWGTNDVIKIQHEFEIST